MSIHAITAAKSLSALCCSYHRGHLICIDVSQSVEHEHPQATEFLRRDCTNVNDYFKRQGSCSVLHRASTHTVVAAGLTTMTVRELFDFCTSETLADDQVEKHLFDLMNHVTERTDDQVWDSQRAGGSVKVAVAD